MSAIPATILFLLVSSSYTSKPGPLPPHLVLMVVDDLGWTDVSFRGGSNFRTPQMDKLATDGVILNKYYVQQVCSPTRAALMTARYPFRTGLQHTTTLAPGSVAAIPKDTATVAEVLKKVGYRTHAIGKWHLGYQGWEDTPIGRGYDSWCGYLNGAIDYYNHRFGFKMAGANGTVGSTAGLDFWRNKSAAWDVDGEHSTGFYMAEATRVLDNHPSNDVPLFVYFAHQLVHEPLELPADAAAGTACKTVPSAPSPEGPNITVGRRTLCTMASEVDSAIGDFVAMLQAKGMWANTVMWLTTDNGGMTSGPKADGVGVWSASSNYPLRGGKATLFEGGVRGTSFVSGGFLPASARGSVRTELMMHVDLSATLAALGGVPADSRSWGRTGVDGLNVWDAVVSGAPSKRSEVPINVDTCVGATGGPPCAKDKRYNALIAGGGSSSSSSHGTRQWKLIEANWAVPGCPNTTWCTGAGMYDGWWSNDPYTHRMPNATQVGMLSADLKGGGVWLFDLATDPNEERNLAAANPGAVKQLRSRLAELADVRHGYKNPQHNIPDWRGAPQFHNNSWAPFLKRGKGTAAKQPRRRVAAEAALSDLLDGAQYLD